MSELRTRLAANLKWLFLESPFVDRFSAAAREGFSAVEVPNPYDESPETVRALVRNAGLEVVLLNTPAGVEGSSTANGSACVPGAEREFRAGVERGLEYALALGCRRLHVVGGRRPEGVSRERAMAQYLHNLEWAVRTARGTGVSLLIEMQNQRSAPGFVLESQRAAAAVVETIDEPLGLLFDTFHTQVADGDLVETFDAVLPYIDHIQIGDAPHRTEPGTGEIAWPFVMTHMLDSSYSGWFGCEFQPDGPTPGLLSRIDEAVGG